MKWTDIFHIVAGLYFLASCFRKKPSRSVAGRLFLAAFGELCVVLGSTGLNHHFGWWILSSQAEHRLKVVLFMLIALQYILGLFLVVFTWSKRPKVPVTAPPQAAPGMKVCAYCGRENDESVVRCSECGTDEFKRPASASRPSETPGPQFVFAPLSATESGNDWVTLLKCQTLLEADMVASQLESAGIKAFVPDQFLMQNAALSLTYGFVRVQVAPKEYEMAKDLLTRSTMSTPPSVVADLAQ